LSNLVQIHRVLRLVQPKLTVEVVTALAEGSQRYTDLVRIITVATSETVHPRTLVETLRKLQEHAIIDHSAIASDGAVYRLTSKGRELVALLNRIERWGQDHSDSFES
jgi:DNA-binding HxlR family transcriptional regulator